MKFRKSFSFLTFLVLVSVIAKAQHSDTSDKVLKPFEGRDDTAISAPKYVGSQTSPPVFALDSDKKKYKAYIVPGSLFLAGGILVMTHSPLHFINTDLSSSIQKAYPGFQVKADDWLQYVPGGASLVLGVVGVSGSHRLPDRFLRYTLATVVATGTVQVLKRWTHVLRPDGSTYNSFPSGHTATAFTGAEMLHQEYGHISSWYSVLGYTVASATGVFRMLNNRHSLADVLGGAGLGMASVKLSYWIMDRITVKRKPTNTPIF